MPFHPRWHAWLAAGLLIVGAANVQAADGPPEAAARAPHFPVKAVNDGWRQALPAEPELATRAYLDRLSPEARARSDAYFEGGYWLTLWNTLVGLAIGALLLWTRPSTAVRDWARRVAKQQQLP